MHDVTFTDIAAWANEPAYPWSPDGLAMEHLANQRNALARLLYVMLPEPAMHDGTLPPDLPPMVARDVAKAVAWFATLGRVAELRRTKWKPAEHDFFMDAFNSLWPPCRDLPSLGPAGCPHCRDGANHA